MGPPPSRRPWCQGSGQAGQGNNKPGESGCTPALDQQQLQISRCWYPSPCTSHFEPQQRMDHRQAPQGSRCCTTGKTRKATIRHHIEGRGANTSTTTNWTLYTPAFPDDNRSNGERPV